MITLANIRRSVYNLFKRVEGIEEFLFQFMTDWTDFKEEGIVANQAFPETWHKTGVLNNLIQDINADDTATTGKVYTTTVSFNDLPSNMLQAELKVEIKEDSGKVILFTLISNETSPYYWLGISSYSGEVVWKSFLTEHQDISGKANSSDLATVATTGDFNDLINTPDVLGGGKSAYELAIDNGYEGTIQQWLASLKGDKGETGLQGLKGDDGNQGPKGDDGKSTYDIYCENTPEENRLNKAQWLASLKGDPGNNGTNGKSAYELAVDNGFEGTEQEWLASLKGPQGILGETGPQGVQGIQGIQGEKGDKGDKGDQGIQGEQGPQGVLGPKGADGTMTFEDLTEEQRESLRGPLGIQGPAGKDGSDGVNGQDGAPGLNGQDGITPHIDPTTKHWMIGETDTNIVAEGQNGSNGTNGLDGVTPHIDSTSKHWMIGETDTGVVAEGLNVADSVTQSELEEVEKVTAIALTQLDERVSDLENDSVSTSSNYYDKSEIDLMFVNAAGGGSVDLGGYVQKSLTAGLLKNDGTVDTSSYLTLHQDISGKANSTDLATVATSGSYTDLSNTPTIPDAQIQSDWNLTDNSSKDYIKNKPQVSDGKTRSPGLSFEPPAKTGTNYTYVDLGLPSGTLWATKNVGASDEYDDGLYFSWGNIEGYAYPSTSIFSLSNYESSIAYTLNSSIQPTTSFDAAKYNMGDPWRMPTRAEVLELIDNTDITWVANQYVKFAKKTDNSVYVIIPNHRDNGHSYDASYTDAWRYAGFLCSDYKYESPGKHYGSRACFVNNNYPDDTDYHYALAVWYYLKTPGFPVRGVQNPNDTNQIEPANYKQISAAKVAVTGSYDDLTNKPTIPQIWTGTQAQYDAITNPDNNTIYIITAT